MHCVYLTKAYSVSNSEELACEIIHILYDMFFGVQTWAFSWTSHSRLAIVFNTPLFCSFQYLFSRAPVHVIFLQTLWRHPK